jgi:hypothetical protein
MDIKQVPHVVIETGGEKIKKSYEQIMERGGNSMFDCGIHEFVAEVSREVTEKHDAMVVEEVRKVGIDIDKPQLERAIIDAKSFYDDGYKDAKKEVFEEVKRVIKNEYCAYDGDCDSCKKEHPYICRLEVELDEILELIDGIKGE